MSSDDDIDIIALAAVAIARRKNTEKILGTTISLIDNVDLYSTYVVSRQLEVHSEKFQEFYRMRKDTNY